MPRGKFDSTNQKHYLVRMGSDASSVWTFCTRFSDVIWRGKPVVASPNVGCFLRLRLRPKGVPFLGLRCMKEKGFTTLKIKKICFSPNVSIQHCRPKSDSALPGAIGAKFRQKKLNQKAIYSCPRWGSFKPLGPNQP